MFIRHKINTNNSVAVQIVATSRKKGAVVQKLVRHVGTAKSKLELELFEKMAARIMVGLEQEEQLSLFSTQQLADMIVKAREKQRLAQHEAKLNVDLKQLREHQRVTIGIHEVYGKLYKQLNFDHVLHKDTAAMGDILQHIVMARLAAPTSKRGAVAMLEKDFGVTMNLQQVYRMMDCIDEQAMERIQHCAYQMTTRLTQGKVKVVLYDCTTLYFESFQPDELKQNGFSKDGKHNQPQVLLALMVNESGLPIGYELFPGATFEGHTLIPALEKLKKRYQLEKLVVVADSGLLNKDNCQYLANKGYEYVLGARLRNLPNKLQEAILDADNYQTLDNQQQGSKDANSDQEQRIGNFEHGDLRLVVNYSAKRARKDAHEREKNLEKLQKRLEKNKSTKAFLGNSGYKKFLDLSQQSLVSVNEQKVAAEARWDGLCGILTNIKDEQGQTLMSHYRGLWQIEACFRVQKHNLKLRPIFHWTPQRIKAHIAICFMAFTAQSYLTHALREQYRAASLEEIQDALLHIQVSILRDPNAQRWFVMPSKLNELAHGIYKVLDLVHNNVPCEITHQINERMASRKERDAEVECSMAQLQAALAGQNIFEDSL